MPGFTFPPVGPLGLGSPPSRLFPSFSRRYYDPLRLPLLHLGSLRISLDPRYLAFSHFRSRHFPGEGDHPSAPGRFSIPVCLSRCPTQGDGGPLEFPGYPWVCMPRSSTPVVSCRLAIASPELLPSGTSRPSALPDSRLDILADHNNEIFGAQSRGLHTRYTRLQTHPHGYACRFATDSAANLLWWDLSSRLPSPTGQHHPVSQTPFRSQGSGFNSTRGSCFLPTP
jgi:hypothetical protein